MTCCIFFELIKLYFVVQFTCIFSHFELVKFQHIVHPEIRVVRKYAQNKFESRTET